MQFGFSKEIVAINIKDVNVRKHIQRNGRSRQLFKFYYMLICVLICVLFSFGNSKDLLTAHTDIFSLTPDQYNEDQYYVVDTDGLLDWYAYDDEGYYYITTVNDKNGDVKYVGYYVYDEYVNIAEEVVADPGEGKIVLKGHGYVYDMDEVEQEYFAEYIEGMGLPRESCVFKTIVLMPLKETFDFTFYWGMIIAGILFLKGLFHLAVMIQRKDLIELKNCFKLYNLSYDALQNDINEEMTAYDYMFFGKSLLVCFAYGAIAVPYNRIVWAYMKKENASFYIHIYTDDRYERKITVSDEKCGNVILERIKEHIPYILLGDTDENVEMYQSDFSGMVEEVQRRKESCIVDERSNIKVEMENEENYRIKNEYVVTWHMYKEWIIEGMTHGILLVFRIIWGVLAIICFGLGFLKDFSYIYFLLAVFCVYQLFIRKYIHARKQYNRLLQQFGNKDWTRTIALSDKYTFLKDNETVIRMKNEDILEVKEKGNKIYLAMKGGPTLLMYESAFVKGSWEECKEMFHK
ncbi:MAG: DUF6709 family protein [Agathobacter sp.]